MLNDEIKRVSLPLNNSPTSQKQNNNKNVRQKKEKEYLREKIFFFNTETGIRLHLKPPRSREVEI